MKKQFVMGIVALGVVASVTAGITYAANAPKGHLVTDVATTQKINAEVTDHRNQVVDDLKKQIHDANSYLVFSYDHENELTSANGQLSKLSTDQRKVLTQSIFSEMNNHGLVNYWIPNMFVKPDGSEYVLGYKNVDTGEDELLTYKLQNNAYVKVEDVKVQGAYINPELSVNKK